MTVTDQLLKLQNHFVHRWQALPLLDLTPEWESHLLNILNFIKANSNDREECILYLQEVATSIALEGFARGSWWVVLYSMRELQWPEIKQAIEEKRRAQGTSPFDWISECMLDAWRPEWRFNGYLDYHDRREGFQPSVMSAF